MSNLDGYRPKLSVDISPEHKQLLDKHFTSWGSKKDLVYVLLDGLFEMVERVGAPKVVGAIASRLITINDVCKLGIKDERKTS